MAGFCSKCGTEIPTGEGFCPKCGGMVSMEIGSTTLQTTNVQSGTGSAISNGERKQSTIGIMAGVFGIVGIVLSFFSIGAIFGIVGIILGIIGLSKRQQYRTGMAVTGIITGGISLLIVIIIWVMTAAYVVGVDTGFDDGWDNGYNRGYDGGYNDGYDVPWYEKW